MPIHGKGGSPGSLGLIQGAERNIYKAEAVLNHQLVGSSSHMHYLVHWRGYLSSEDTWEQSEHLQGCVLLTKYEQARSRWEAAHLSHLGQLKGSAACLGVLTRATVAG